MTKKIIVYALGRGEFKYRLAIINRSVSPKTQVVFYGFTGYRFYPSDDCCTFLYKPTQLYEVIPYEVKGVDCYG